MLESSAMEDQFANILQRNYGLKAVGKSASYGPRSDERTFGRALDRGKSVGSGLGRANQSAAAAILLAGDNLGTLSKSARQADPHWTYGNAPDQGLRGPGKNSSVGGHDEIYREARSGSASRPSFAEFLEGKVTGASAERPFNEDVPVVYSQSVSRPSEQSTQIRNERDAPEYVARRPSRPGESRRSTEEEFLEALTGEPKTGSEAGSAPSSYDGPRSLPLKSAPSADSDSPLKGSFMRGFGWSKTAMPAPQLGPGKTGDSPWERSPGEGTNGLTRRRARTSSAASSVSVDVSEAECVGRSDSVSGFTIPASNGTPFPDLNEPYVPSSMDSPREELSQPKVSSSEPDSGETLRKSREKLPESAETPKTPVAATAEQKSSGPGPFAAESRSHASSEGASTEESVPMRRALDLNAMVDPSVSSSQAHRSRKSTRSSDAVNRPNGSASSLDEPLTKFEVSIGAGGGSHRARRKSGSSADGWLTVDQIRLVTQPSTFPPPTRPPPPPPPPPSHSRRYSGVDGRRGSQKSESSGTTKGRSSQGPEESETDKQRSSPSSEVFSIDKLPSSQKAQQSADVQGMPNPAGEEVSGNERANGGVAKQAENQKTGYVLPEVTVVDLGPEEMKPSREERRRIREQMERERRRAKREEERVKEKEKLQQEVVRESMFADSRREKALDPRDPISNDTDTSGGREASRPRMGRREKVFDPRERHFQETASRREDKDIQYRNLRQQEKELQARLARQDARERENERAGDKLRRSAEKAALEAHEIAERAAVERAVQEAHERAERAARQRAAAAREKERVKEKEREREKERDREEEKLRDRLREKERGLGEQFHTRDSFRATSEPRQRPAVSATPPSGLSRLSSGGNLRNLSVAAETRNSASVRKGVDELTKVHGQSGSGIPERFDEIPGEPADRRTLRLEKQMLIEERSAKALKERNMRDQALQREQEERQRLAGGVDADVRRWSAGKEGNLRALLSTLHMMLWPECNWKVVSLPDLVASPAVKKAYQRAILCVHPDKVQQKGANVKQKYVAEKVFDLLKDAYAKFNSEL